MRARRSDVALLPMLRRPLSLLVARGPPAAASLALRGCAVAVAAVASPPHTGRRYDMRLLVGWLCVCVSRSAALSLCLLPRQPLKHDAGVALTEKGKRGGWLLPSSVHHHISIYFYRQGRDESSGGRGWGVETDDRERAQRWCCVVCATAGGSRTTHDDVRAGRPSARSNPSTSTRDRLRCFLPQGGRASVVGSRDDDFSTLLVRRAAQRPTQRRVPPVRSWLLAQEDARKTHRRRRRATRPPHRPPAPRRRRPRRRRPASAPTIATRRALRSTPGVVPRARCA